jgi:hypothetical protein
MIYPVGEPYADQANLDFALENTDFPKDIVLMDQNLQGKITNFLLPSDPECTCYRPIDVRRDIGITGSRSPNGKGPIIEGGCIAFSGKWNEEDAYYNLSINKVSFLNQSFAAVSGHFNDFIFKENLVSNDPLPPPAPNFGVYIESTSNLLQIKNNTFATYTGIVCNGTDKGDISFNSIRAIDCGIYLTNSQNSIVKGNVAQITGLGSGPGFANIILDGTSGNNKIEIGKLSGNAFFGMMVLGSGESGFNSILMMDVKNLDCTIASIGIDPLGNGTVNNTTIKGGPGSVSNDPLPPPRGIVLDNGLNTQVALYRKTISGTELPDGFATQLDYFYSKLNAPSEGEGGGDLG